MSEKHPVPRAKAGTTTPREKDGTISREPETSSTPCPVIKPGLSRKPGLPRKRGGQPGNRNHYKHGFYAHNFSEQECTYLNHAKDLEGELKAVRVIANRILTRISNAGLGPEGDEDGEISERTLQAINSLNVVFSNIANLTRAHMIETGKYEPTETAILDALNEMNLEQGYMNV